MDANKIIVQREQSHGMRMVFNFLAETICQSRKSARVHTDAEIGSLRERRADVLRVRVAFDPLLMGAGALSWAVMTLGAL